MPNWCYNVLTVSGPKKEIRKLKDAVSTVCEDGSEEKFDFNKILPMPEELLVTAMSLPADKSRWSKEDVELDKKYRENIKKYGFKDWYDWRLEYWDTKWNACDCILERHENYVNEDIAELEYRFNTAWCFPMSIALKVSQMFPTLKFEWMSNEESGSFDFIAVFEGGRPTEYSEGFEDNTGDISYVGTKLAYFLTGKQFIDYQKKFKEVEAQNA